MIGILLVLDNTAPPRDPSLEPFKAQLVGYLGLINGWYPEEGLLEHIPIGAEVASGYVAGLCLTGLASCRGPVGRIRNSSAKASLICSAAASASGWPGPLSCAPLTYFSRLRK